ncbi:MAG TPA: hypothetical protein PK359_01210 [Burkholderiaceae bacterium]|jgi:hypothetical protein|nr:hypothetical protein [Burkholderiaceae bacterium]
MSKQAPFDDSEVTALLSRISRRAAQTVRDAAGDSRPPPGALSGSLPGATPDATPKAPGRSAPVKSTPALLRPAGGAGYGRRRSDPPRTAPQVRTLNEQAVALLQILPPQIRLVALRGGYPRIVNQLAALWDDPKAFDEYVDSLLIDKRGKRQGFPFPVVADLSELRTYHQRHVRPRGT